MMNSAWTSSASAMASGTAWKPALCNLSLRIPRDISTWRPTWNGSGDGKDCDTADSGTSREPIANRTLPSPWPSPRGRGRLRLLLDGARGLLYALSSRRSERTTLRAFLSAEREGYIGGGGEAGRISSGFCLPSAEAVGTLHRRVLPRFFVLSAVESGCAVTDGCDLRFS